MDELNYNKSEWNAKEFNERSLNNKQNLYDLVYWLEYDRETGYRSARCSRQQEEYWADELKKLLRENDKK